MRRLLGVVLVVAGLYAVAVAFFGAPLPGERARMAEIADYGSSSKADPRYLVFLAGALLIGGGSRLLRKD